MTVMKEKAPKRLLSRIPVHNNMHYTWSFTHRLMEATGRRGKVQRLDKLDLDFIGDRDQIKIWGRSVRAYIQHDTEVVSVYMNLPDKVDRIILFRYGQRNRSVMQRISEIAFIRERILSRIPSLLKRN